MKKHLYLLTTFVLGTVNNFFTTASAQTFGFETGLTGWSTVGNVTIDTRYAYNGKACVKIGSGYGAVMKKTATPPLSIVSVSTFIKSGVEKAKGYSFLRFYDSANTLLLEYKSKPLSFTSYESTGNYTESPPFTKYMITGVEKDSSDEALFVDEFKIEIRMNEPVKKHAPLCNLDQYMLPFWNSGIIYNETVLLYSANGQAANGRLLYKPSEIISVKSFDLSTAYMLGKDYSVKGNVITRVKSSQIPFRADTSFDREKDLAWYNLQSQWVVVTYKHKDKWNGPVPDYMGSNMPHTMAKLKAKLALTIVAYGMSITRGMDVSGYDTVPPYMPPYVDLFAYQLRKIYGYNNIAIENAGLPGSTVDWAAEYAGNYINPLKPDLVIIDFGMNDFWRFTPAEFSDYIKTIINKVKGGNPNVEFLLLSNMQFDPDYILDSDKNKSFYVSNMTGYNLVLKKLQSAGIINLDMNTVSDLLYKKKKAKDCIVNPLHPNDYLARWYAQEMVALFDRQK